MNTLAIFDLHLGSGRSLALSPELQERLVPQLEWADRLLIGGDLIHTAPMARVQQGLAKFWDFAGRYVSEVIFLPGNHEYWMLAAGHRLAASSGGDPLGYTQDIISAWLPGASVEVHHPAVSLEGVSVVHGYQLLAHALGQGESQDYDALLGPYFEACWALEQHPRGMDPEMFRLILSRMGRIVESGSDRTRPIAEVLEWAASMSQGLGIPEGPVILGHLHQQIAASEVGGYQFLSPGGWVLDGFVMDMDPDPMSAHPGGVVRIGPDGLEPLRLLDDLDRKELERLAL